MTMVDNQHRPYGGMSYDNIYSNSLHFTDPWSHPPTNHSSLYPTTLGSNNPGLSSMVKQETSRPTSISMPYSSIPVSAPSLVAGGSYPSTGYGTSDLPSLPQDGLPRSSYGSDHSYSSASPAHNSYATTAAYHPISYAQSLHQQQHQQSSDSSRRVSQTSVLTLPWTIHGTQPPCPSRILTKLQRLYYLTNI
jgi:hypothetical protein